MDKTEEMEVELLAAATDLPWNEEEVQAQP
jgi:hypothetical protein